MQRRQEREEMRQEAGRGRVCPAGPGTNEGRDVDRDKTAAGSGLSRTECLGQE